MVQIVGKYELVENKKFYEMLLKLAKKANEAKSFLEVEVNGNKVQLTNETNVNNFVLNEEFDETFSAKVFKSTATLDELRRNSSLLKPSLNPMPPGKKNFSCEYESCSGFEIVTENKVSKNNDNDYESYYNLNNDSNLESVVTRSGRQIMPIRFNDYVLFQRKFSENGKFAFNKLKEKKWERPMMDEQFLECLTNDDDLVILGLSDDEDNFNDIGKILDENDQREPEDNKNNYQREPKENGNNDQRQPEDENKYQREPEENGCLQVIAFLCRYTANKNLTD
ncbi:hypothetical protein NQ314_006759 [Rhamnusium bicolor]|uniref:Uncharacterized protein n=1 Tax=Rhamnusium bicolor TaxID=1586634 RepID=A0AAV8YXE7_9CUCU|nr:hypothetical protein NQ314_006759 [Rhamnusium bicolor]